MPLLHSLRGPRIWLLEIMLQHSQLSIVSNSHIMQQFRQVIGIRCGRHLQAAGGEL